MTKYRAILAYTVSCYHTVEIEAADEDEADDKAQEILEEADSEDFEPDWGGAHDYRIADIIPEEEGKP